MVDVIDKFHLHAFIM